MPHLPDLRARGHKHQVNYTFPSHFGVGSMQLYVQAEKIYTEPTQLSKEEIEILGIVVIDPFCG